MSKRQASDYVIWSIVRRQNSKSRAYANFNTLPHFTREAGNLIQRSTFKYSGFRRKFVGVGQRRARKHEGEQYTLVMARRGRSRKPRKSVARCIIHKGSKKKLKKEIRTQLNMRLYRPELANMARKRMLKIADTRKKYKWNLRRENALDLGDEKDENGGDNNNNNNEDDDAPMEDIN